MSEDFTCTNAFHDHDAKFPGRFLKTYSCDLISNPEIHHGMAFVVAIQLFRDQLLSLSPPHSFTASFMSSDTASFLLRFKFNSRSSYFHKISSFIQPYSSSSQTIAFHPQSSNRFFPMYPGCLCFEFSATRSPYRMHSSETALSLHKDDTVASSSEVPKKKTRSRSKKVSSEEFLSSNDNAKPKTRPRKKKEASVTTNSISEINDVVSGDTEVNSKKKRTGASKAKKRQQDGMINDLSRPSFVFEDVVTNVFIREPPDNSFSKQTSDQEDADPDISEKQNFGKIEIVDDKNLDLPVSEGKKGTISKISSSHRGHPKADIKSDGRNRLEDTGPFDENQSRNRVRRRNNEVALKSDVEELDFDAAAYLERTQKDMQWITGKKKSSPNDSLRENDHKATKRVVESTKRQNVETDTQSDEFTNSEDVTSAQISQKSKVMRTRKQSIDRVSKNNARSKSRSSHGEIDSLFDSVFVDPDAPIDLKSRSVYAGRMQTGESRLTKPKNPRLRSRNSGTPDIEFEDNISPKQSSLRARTGTNLSTARGRDYRRSSAYRDDESQVDNPRDQRGFESRNHDYMSSSKTFPKGNFAGKDNDRKFGESKERAQFMDFILFKKKPDLDSAFRMVHEGTYKPTMKDFEYIATTHYSMGRYKILLRIVEEAETEWGTYPPLSIKTCTLLIVLYGKTKNLAKALSVLEDMKRFGPQPNNITYNALIAACAKSGDVEMAFNAFDDLEANNFQPDNMTFGALMDACSKAADYERAFKVAEKMEHYGIEKDEKIYSILIESCARSKQLELAFLVFEEMKRKGSWPNLITFALLIDACATAKEPQRAFEVFREIKQWGLQPNILTCTALIDACAKGSWPERGQLVFESMQNAGIQPTEVTYAALIDGWCRVGNLDKAFENVAEMTVNGLRPSPKVFNGLYEACQKAGKLSRARKCINIMAKNPRNRHMQGIFADLIKLCIESEIETAVGIAEDARRAGLLKLLEDNPLREALVQLKMAVYKSGKATLKKRVSGITFAPSRNHRRL